PLTGQIFVSLLLWLKDLSGNNQLLNLTGAFIDTQGADLAIKSLDRLSRDHAAATEKLHGVINDVLRSLCGEKLCHGRFASDALGAVVARPGRAVNQQ